MHTTNYDRIEAAIRYLATHRQRQPELADLAAHIGLSQSHLHRLFLALGRGHAKALS